MEYVSNSSQNPLKSLKDERPDDCLNQSQPVIDCATVEVSSTQTKNVSFDLGK